MGPGARIALLAAALLGLAALPVAGQSARDSLDAGAERAAREWLWLLDETRYDTAWTVVAPAMRSAVDYRRWATSLERLRAVLPRVRRRELLRAEPSVPLFGGRSFILSFAVGGMREVVVLVRAGSRWQVGGYGILVD